MRDTLGSQGVQLLLNRMSERERKTQEADRNANTAESGDTVENYDSAMDKAAQESKNAQETSKGEFSTGQGNNSVVQPPSAVKNPITVIKRIMKMGVLELVLSLIHISTISSRKNLKRETMSASGRKPEHRNPTDIIISIHIIITISSRAL